MCIACGSASRPRACSFTRKRVPSSHSFEEPCTLEPLSALGLWGTGSSDARKRLLSPSPFPPDALVGPANMPTATTAISPTADAALIHPFRLLIPDPLLAALSPVGVSGLMWHSGQMRPGTTFCSDSLRKPEVVGSFMEYGISKFQWHPDYRR